MQVFIDPERENDEYALPDVEVFYVEIDENDDRPDVQCDETGWYYWFCFPGCMPDSDPIGPFDTEEEAIADAQEEN